MQQLKKFPEFEKLADNVQKMLFQKGIQIHKKTPGVFRRLLGSPYNYGLDILRLPKTNARFKILEGYTLQHYADVEDDVMMKAVNPLVPQIWALEPLSESRNIRLTFYYNVCMVVDSPRYIDFHKSKFGFVVSSTTSLSFWLRQSRNLLDWGNCSLDEVGFAAPSLQKSQVKRYTESINHVL
ncbi:hypothetical protein PHMEG_00023989 [Phytophthora megakarya]|uniref:Uncharacterized protein n=1 Tax=Phytophthora megakarya TaxID=4795 RepID=A0A225VGA4_9STRA|nr:hypothetical protein PHMEG_00023989 [Phytophthora megakarya]